MFPFISAFLARAGFPDGLDRSRPGNGSGPWSGGSFPELRGSACLLAPRPQRGCPLFSAEAAPYTCLRLDGLCLGTLVRKKKPVRSRKKTGRTKSRRDFPAVFAALKKILTPYEKRLRIVRYKPEFYYLETLLPRYKGKAVCFGAVRLGKTYVSYYLMPVYMNPALEKRISPELKKRMQGKSCFSFTESDPVLFRELAALTRAGFASFRALKFV
jgi:hypothetical protein